jgi:aldehyde:ferredoxin oxidoreductase
MNPKAKIVLYVNLNEWSYQIKIHENFNCFLGGLALGMAIVLNERRSSPITFNCGPLSGLFPFASKTAAIYLKKTMSLGESFGGGKLALVMKMSGFDSIVFSGKSSIPVGVAISNKSCSFIPLAKKTDTEKFRKDGVLGKRSVVEFVSGVSIDSYFSFGDTELAQKARESNLVGFMLSGTNSYNLLDKEYYERIYFDILSKPLDLKTPFLGFRSCGGCPAGCRYSRFGEQTKENAVLPKCLVSCGFATSIYKSVPRVFSCLESLGYHYNHDDLEKIAEIVGKMRPEFSNRNKLTSKL